MLIVSNHFISENQGFEWDENKYRQILANRNISFVDAIEIFEQYKRFTYLSKNSTIIEKRYVTVGVLKNKLYAVIYTTRDENIRIITARRTHVTEERIYKTLYT